MLTAALQTAINNRLLTGRDLDFAIDLCRAERKYGRLSERQAPWVGKLLARANGTEAPRPVQSLGNVAELVALFNRPRLKFPAIRLQTASGEPVVLRRAGAAAKVPGSITVTDGAPYGSSRWYGRVTVNGAWEQPTGGAPAEVVAVVEALAQNPAETAAAYGRVTGSCCFCGRGLEDARSIEVGYGPVCAEHYGLPWGARLAAAA